uniref:Uncharacterized protein n=1 Tax=Mus spicilegus TaxID=10103 RepID=A0A8C6IEL1_MUSSI
LTMIEVSHTTTDNKVQACLSQLPIWWAGKKICQMVKGNLNKEFSPEEY